MEDNTGTGTAEGSRATRTLAIGDIHGCLVAFETLAEAVGISASDTLVTLGDYVDRGPDSRGVINYLLSLRERTNLFPLRGNHEIMMLEARESEAMAEKWLLVGGAETLVSYGGALEDVPEEHWEFIDGLLRYHETEHQLFVHANSDPELPLEEQRDEILFWRRFGAHWPHRSGKLMVCGHTPQQRGIPADLGHAICIDTFAYGGGWLTCLDVDSGVFWQANNRGEFRKCHRDFG